MEGEISRLVRQFETGVLSRRQLIYALAAMAAAMPRAAQGQEVPFRSTGIDHISVQVTDMARSMDFYQSVFGLKVLSEDKPNEIVRLGATRTIVSLHRKPPTGIVDHFAIGIDGFDREAVTNTLARRGLKAETNLDYGFHVRDPEGVPVQIVAG